MQPVPSAQLTGGQPHAASIGRRASRQLQRQSYVKLQLGQEGSGDVLTDVSIFPPNSRWWPCLHLLYIFSENQLTLIYKCLNPVNPVSCWWIQVPTLKCRTTDSGLTIVIHGDKFVVIPPTHTTHPNQIASIRA